MLPALCVLSGCAIKYERAMTEAAQLTADKVCGVYKAVEATWDGEPLDVNNDGIARESFMEELLKGEYLGLQYKEDELTTTVQPCYRSGSITSVAFPFFLGYYSDSDLRFSIPLYTCDHIIIAYEINDEGVLTIKDQYSYIWLTGQKEHAKVENVSITWEDGDFLISADTGFYNYLSQTFTEGRATFRYHCISTKEEKQR